MVTGIYHLCKPALPLCGESLPSYTISHTHNSQDACMYVYTPDKHSTKPQVTVSGTLPQQQLLSDAVNCIHSFSSAEFKHLTEQEASIHRHYDCKTNAATVSVHVLCILLHSAL